MIRSIITASIFFLFLNIYLPAWSQEEKKTLTLTAPFKDELHLSGSFGEVRTNFFHAGIDFRTGGKVGKRVY
ncbi:MAG: M23 family peptidase, partial [Perlabentimonas sp.]